MPIELARKSGGVECVNRALDSIGLWGGLLFPKAWHEKKTGKSAPKAAAFSERAGRSAPQFDPVQGNQDH